MFLSGTVNSRHAFQKETGSPGTQRWQPSSTACSLYGWVLLLSLPPLLACNIRTDLHIPTLDFSLVLGCFKHMCRVALQLSNMTLMQLKIVPMWGYMRCIKQYYLHTLIYQYLIISSPYYQRLPNSNEIRSLILQSSSSISGDLSFREKFSLSSLSILLNRLQL